jgi:hypothetical protein
MRCKSCDEVMKASEILWYEDIGEHESLCTRCRKIVDESDDVITTITEDEIDNSIDLIEFGGSDHEQ